MLATRATRFLRLMALATPCLTLLAACEPPGGDSSARGIDSSAERTDAPARPMAGVERTWTEDPEVTRIREHLSLVSSELRATVPDGLSDAQRGARAATIAWLDEYRRNRVFPHNHVLPGGRVPVFVDPHGTPCAVGYLLLRSGEHDLVEEIVRTDNLVRVPDLRGDARLASWLESRGLTLAEAARIQPAYEPRPPLEQASKSSYRATTVGLSIATAALASYSAMAEPRAGAPWVDGLTVGAALGHTYLLVDARGSGNADEPAWAQAANFLGLMVGAASQIVRLSRRGGDDTPAVAAARSVRPYLRPGRYGTEVGVVVPR